LSLSSTRLNLCRHCPVRRTRSYCGGGTPHWQFLSQWRYAVHLCAAYHHHHHRLCDRFCEKCQTLQNCYAPSALSSSKCTKLVFSLGPCWGSLELSPSPIVDRLGRGHHLPISIPMDALSNSTATSFFYKLSTGHPVG